MANHPKTIAIIGAGQAAAEAVRTLRQAGFDGRLFLIGDEPHAPYQRPPLSKKYLSGELTPDRLALFPEKFYTDNNVECLFATRVAALDAVARRVTLDDGATLTFDRALIATGSRPRPLPVPGAASDATRLDRVFTLRTIADIDRMRSHICPGGRLVIVGAGYIGLEVAAITRGLGLAVHVIEAAPRVMARTAPAIVASHVERLHVANGVTFAFGAGVTSITATPSGDLAVAATTGLEIADWVLVGIGGVPDVELAAAAGLAIDNGIVVDDHCRTSAPDIFATGDCTNFPSARYGRRVRLESVQNAIDQARAAAHAMLDKTTPYDPVPWFWSDQYDAKIQIAGLSHGSDAEVVRGDPATGSFSVAHLRGRHLIALDAVNAPRDYMAARRLFATTAEVDPTALADPDIPLDRTRG